MRLLPGNFAQDASNRRYNLAPALRFRGELLLSRWSQLVKLRLTIVLTGSPIGGESSAVLQAVQSRI